MPYRMADVPDGQLSGDLPFRIVSGTESVLRLQPLLASLARQCLQPGAADYIHYFLTQPYTGGKIPTLLLLPRSESSAMETADELLAAVLLHQYQKLGVPLGIFVSEDSGGERNVIAPAALRSALAVRAASCLMDRNAARMVVLSLNNASFDTAIQHERGSGTWATASRTLKRYLPLAATYEETLNTFGTHTRRNFRLYRRRAAENGGCVFEPHASVSEASFLHLNGLSDHQVPSHVAQWRYRSSHAEPGGVFAGLRRQNGEWISIVGGRRSCGIFAMDWQMNRAGLPELSPTTLMRGYLIEHEIALGTTQMLFEGGTPHPMNSAFREEVVTDIVGTPSSVTSALLRKYVPRFLPDGNFLKQTLLNPSLVHHDRSSGA